MEAAFASTGWAILRLALGQRPSTQMKANGRLHRRLWAKETSLWDRNRTQTATATGNHSCNGLLETSNGTA